MATAKRKNIKKSSKKKTAPKKKVFKSNKLPEAKKILSNGLAKRPKTISEEQWKLPAGFTQDGKMASLAEVLSDPIPTFSLESLSAKQKKDLIIERIKKQQDYPSRYMLGIGEVNKDRAIVEVEAGSSAGKFIQESEQMVIQLMQKKYLK